MTIIILITAGMMLLSLGYLGFSIRKEQFLQIKEYATFMADLVGGKIIKWSLLIPTGSFAIFGLYQGHKIKMYLYLDQTKIYIYSDALPKQNNIIISYPEVAEGIYQIGKSLTTTVRHNELRDPILKKTHTIEGMEKLINSAKRLENKTAV